jgi:hypothetical protein
MFNMVDYFLVPLLPNLIFEVEQRTSCSYLPPFNASLSGRGKGTRHVERERERDNYQKS